MIPTARGYEHTLMSRVRLPFTAMLAAAALLVGCGGSEKKSTATKSMPAPSAAPAAAAPEGTSVTIQGFKYAPPSISTKVGATLTFKNLDSAEHTATAEMKSAFDSGTLNKGQSKTVTFKKAGTFAYHCDFHPFMHGTVVVKPGARQTAGAAPAPKASQAAGKAPAHQSSGKAAAPKTDRSSGVGGGSGY